MKKIIGAVLFSTIFISAYIGYKHNDDLKPRFFAEGIITTADDEFGITFTPDGKTCYFGKRTPSTINSSVMVICYSEFKNGHWSEPAIAPFSGHYLDFGPSISPDGSKLFFVSNRPVNHERKFDTDIWMVEKSAGGWSEPVHLDSTINSNGFELGCSVSANGNLYFNAYRDGNQDIYRSVFLNGKYTRPEKLDSAINTAYGEADPYIAPDESYILFSSSGREDALKGDGPNYPRSDIYISYKKNGQWQPAIHLQEPVNSTAEESNPYVSPDGKTLFFTSERNFISLPMPKRLDYKTLEKNLHSIENGLGNIYQVSMDVVRTHP